MSDSTSGRAGDSFSDSAVSKADSDASKPLIEYSAKDSDCSNEVGIKARINRSWKDQNGFKSWVTQAEYEKLTRVAPKPAINKEEEKPQPAVTLDTYNTMMSITLHSPWLVKAYKKVYDRLILSKSEESTISEMIPFPSFLFYLDKIDKEIASLPVGKDNEDATRDFNALKFVLGEATGDNVSSVSTIDLMGDSVYYDQIWGTFLPGTLVVCQDELGSRSVLMLAKVKVKKGHSNLYTWILGWDSVCHKFKRQRLKFVVHKFQERKKLTSLVVYPLNALPESERNELLLKRQEQGRKWAQLVSGPPSCFFYKHLSYFTSTADPLTATNSDDSLELGDTIQSVCR
jgi:hypothetical protein